MKLATLKSSSKDGDLLVINKEGSRAVNVSKLVPNFLYALDYWSKFKDPLNQIYIKLNEGKQEGAFDINIDNLASPLPRSFAWLDGSAYLQHVKLVRKARGADLPEDLLKVPLMYQGGSDYFLSPTEDIPQINFEHGTDFEGEVGVILDDVEMGSSPEEAEKKILFFVLINDISLRGIIPNEIKNGFGFLQGKPPTAFSPFAVSPDELGDAYKNGRLHLPLHVEYNGSFFGKANAKEMHFSFGELIAHAARTRPLKAGTILGSGTVSNEDSSVGSSCLAEKRMIEVIRDGKPSTSFMKVGDRVKIYMLDEKGNNIFGSIEQKVVSSQAQDLPYVR